MTNDDHSDEPENAPGAPPAPPWRETDYRTLLDLCRTERDLFRAELAQVTAERHRLAIELQTDLDAARAELAGARNTIRIGRAVEDAFRTELAQRDEAIARVRALLDVMDEDNGDVFYADDFRRALSGGAP